MDFLSFSPTVNILEIATSLFSVDKDKAAREENAKLLLKRLYVECRQNLDVLNLVKLDEVNSQSFKAVKAIAPLLKNETGQLILLGSPECLEKINIIQEELDDKDMLGCDEDNQETFEKAKTLKEAIVFCVNKIEILKNYANIPEDCSELFTTLTLSTRLKNIICYTRQIADSIRNSSYFVE